LYDWFVYPLRTPSYNTNTQHHLTISRGREPLLL
jgi:hypothetical protein